MVTKALPVSVAQDAQPGCQRRPRKRSTRPGSKPSNSTARGATATGHGAADASAPWKYDSQDTMGNRIYVRNPYYWAVDSAGNRTPCADAIERTVVENREVLTARYLAGEARTTAWFLTLANYPLYKENEQKGNYTTNLHPDLRASECGFCFNYTNDEVLRTLFQDLRWRRRPCPARAEPRRDQRACGSPGWASRSSPSCTRRASGRTGWTKMYIEYSTRKRASCSTTSSPLGHSQSSGSGRDSEPWPDHGSRHEPRGPDRGLQHDRDLLGRVTSGLTVQTQASGFLCGAWRRPGASACGPHRLVEVYSRQGATSAIARRGTGPTPAGRPLWRQWLDTKGAEGMEPRRMRSRSCGRRARRGGRRRTARTSTTRWG